ncbi:MAG: sialidase family protein [Pyrinomonadaceae bacterium]
MKEKIAFVASIILLFSGTNVVAQVAAPPPETQQTKQIINVGDDRPVEINSKKFVAVEPHLVANPQNPNHLLAGVILVSKFGDVRRESSEYVNTCAALTSFDAGKTWARYDFPVKECFDPWVAILPNGSAVFLAGTLGTKGTNLVSFRSLDGGRTWGDKPVGFEQGHDHGTMAVDASNSSFSGSVYVASHQSLRGKPSRSGTFIARSTDSGTSFQKTASVIPSNLDTFAMNPVVLSDGMLIVPFMNFNRPSSERGNLPLERHLSWIITSADGGKSFSSPLFLSEVCARTAGFPELAVDKSNGQNRDRLYYVCTDRDSKNVYVSASANRGESWSEPVAVNSAYVRRPYVQNTVIDVNRNGVVGIAWYDSRNDPRQSRGTFRCQDIYFSASLDGGKTFLPEVKVSSAENCPDTPANGEAGRHWLAGGDYFGLAADANGEFHLLWSDSRDGIYQLRTATVKVAANNVSSSKN